MNKHALKEIHAFNNGVNTPDSFYIWRYPDHIPEVCKLVFDLLLRFRAVQDSEAPVDFTEIDSFAEAAIGMVYENAASYASSLEGKITVRDVGGGKLEWGAKGRGDGERAPTDIEMAWYEGESGLLFEAANGAEAERARRLFAAFGLYSCGRALAEIRAGGPSEEAVVYLATAGRCLGYARVYSGWSWRDEIAREERRRGGNRPREENPEKAVARRCAQENPGLSAVQIKMRAKLKASERSIRKWISESS